MPYSGHRRGDSELVRRADVEPTRSRVSWPVPRSGAWQWRGPVHRNTRLKRAAPAVRAALQMAAFFQIVITRWARSPPAELRALLATGAGRLDGSRRVDTVAAGRRRRRASARRASAGGQVVSNTLLKLFVRWRRARTYAEWAPRSRYRHLDRPGAVRWCLESIQCAPNGVPPNYPSRVAGFSPERFPIA
jgi:hypothetical protein